jgi:NAD(P)-dependent dehydrogenase (short-subunit alcohol dehydrogenase family)
MDKNIFSLQGKKILVTGASSGIGKQIAISIASNGGQVVISGRNTLKLSATLELLEGSDHQMTTADLNNKDEVEKIIDTLPALDGVVLNSGIMETLPFKFITEDKLDHLVKTNFTSPIMLLNKIIRKKLLKKQSSVVFISSIGGNVIGTIGNGMYSASKAAISGIQKVLALELAQQRIRVNSVCPGMVKTEMWMEDETITKEQLDADEKKYPLGYGEPADVANAAIYLLSDAARWVTGTSLILDGGFSIQ